MLAGSYLANQKSSMTLSKKLAVPAIALAAFIGGAGLMVSTSAFAAGNPGGGADMHPLSHGVSGTVASVSGSTITLTGTDGKTYTIDAASTTVDKLSSISVGQIVAGDTLHVGGTVSGTNVTAEHIMDGQLPQGGPRGGFGHRDHDGDRGPGVVGTVSAVNGSSLTVAGKNGTTYTVDASSANVMKFAQGTKPAASTVSSIVVGDTVGIRGTVSGTTVTATDIMDGIPSMGMHRGQQDGK